MGAIFGLLVQRSGRTKLSAVARSNYDAVRSDGVEVRGEQLDGGGTVTFQHVFRALGTSSNESNDSLPPQHETFSYIIVATKLIADVKPSVVECLEPYVSPGKSTIVLIQNGVGIEDDIQARWPDNLVLTCVVRVFCLLL